MFCRGGYALSGAPAASGAAAPAASLTVAPATGVAPLTVVADASASTALAASYSFDFGDRSPPLGPQPAPTAEHTYAEGGTYTVSVTVTDGGGQSATASSSVSVDAGIVGNASFESGTLGWNTTASTPDPAHALTRVAGGHSGAFAAELANTQPTAAGCVLNDAPNWVAKTTAGGQYTASVWVRADAPGAAVKLRVQEWSDDPTGVLGEVVSVFTLTTSWQQISVRYRPNAPGASSLDFKVMSNSLIAAGGTCFYADDAAIVFRRAPVASLSVSPTAEVGALAVHADASASMAGDLPIASYSFDFGDRSPLSGPQPAATADHSYLAGGTYTVRVTVTDSGGQSATATSQVSLSGIVTNPSFGMDAAGWNTSGSSPGVVLTRVAGGHGGAWAAQVANGGTTGAGCVLNDAPNWVATTADARYLASLWVRSDTPGATLKLKLREYRKDTGVLVGTASSAVTLTSSWQQLAVNYLVSAPGASTLDYTASVTNVGAGSTCFYADDAAIDLKPAPPPEASLTLTQTSNAYFANALPVSVHADASASRVTDSPIASYSFDFGDGSPVVGPQAEPTADHTYWMSFDHLVTVTVTVTDTYGRWSIAQQYQDLNSSSSNSSFEKGTWGWNTSGSSPGVTLTQVPGGHSGAFAARLANGGTTAGTCALNDSPDAFAPTRSGTYTAWLWARADTPGATLKLKLREYREGDDALVGQASSAITLTTSWQLVSVTYAPVAPLASSLDYSAYVSNAAAGSTCFYADDAIARFEPGATASLSVTPATGAAPLAVRADASASTSWGTTIASYSFDFGDGSALVGPQSDPTADHSYTFAGTYTVNLTVTDTAGRSATTTRQVTVTNGTIANSSFEAGTTGWNTAGSGAGVTLTRVAGGHNGASAAQLANRGTGTAACILNDAPNWLPTTVSGGRYTASLWVRSDTPGTTLKLKLREYRKDNSALVGEAKNTITLTTTWQQVTIDYTPLAPGASTLDYTASVENAAAGSVCFDADDAALTFAAD